MKLTFLLCLALLIGIAIGMWGARLVYLNADLQEVMNDIHEMSTRNASNAQLWLSTLEAVEKGDSAKAERISCLSLRTALSGVQPDEGGPAIAAKTRELLERARSKVAELQQSGICAWHAPIGS